MNDEHCQSRRVRSLPVDPARCAGRIGGTYLERVMKKYVPYIAFAVVAAAVLIPELAFAWPPTWDY